MEVRNKVSHQLGGMADETLGMYLGAKEYAPGLRGSDRKYTPIGLETQGRITGV